MPTQNTLFFILATAWCAMVATAQETVNAKFSIYLIPGERNEVNENFDRVKDIHYAYGDKNIPVSLKEARQSMAYPYSGPETLIFFHVQMVDGEEKRMPLCSTVIPEGARNGILIMREDDNIYSISSHWFGNKELLGGGRILNLSNRIIALKIADSKNPTVIEPNKEITLRAEFTDQSGFGFIPVLGHVQEERPDGTLVSRKALYKHFVFREDDAHLVLILSKQSSIQSICLSGNGVPNNRALQELQEHLPNYMKEKPTEIPAATTETQ